MKKIFVYLVVLLSIFAGTLMGQAQTSKSNLSGLPLRGAGMLMQPPAKGEPAMENKFKLMLYRANRKHEAYLNRYRPTITHREYIDCNYYKYVNCEDYAFCRCYQCKDWAYPFEPSP